MVGGPARMMNGGGSSPAFPYPVYNNPNPSPRPGAPARMTDGSATAGTNMSSSTRPSVPYSAPSNPVGLYIGSGKSADVANGDKVYKQSVAGGYYNNVYNSAGQKVASYFHANPTAPQMNDGTGVTGQATAPNHTVPTYTPPATVSHPSVPATHTTAPTGGVTFTPVPNPKPTAGKTTVPVPKPNPAPGSQKTVTPPVQTAPSQPTQPAPTTGQQSGNSLDPMDASLFNDWSNTMGNLGNTNNPAFQQEVQGLAQQLNDKYYQQWLTQRDKMGGQGLGQSGFLGNDQLREQMAEQNDLAGQYSTLLQNYMKDQLSQATNYSDMMKNMMPYYNLTAQNQVADQQAAQKLMDAQLNAAGYADVNGQTMPTANLLNQIGTQTGQYYNPLNNYSPTQTLAAQKVYDQYNLLTPDQYATLSGYLPSNYGGGATLANTNDALGRQIQIAGLTGQWNGNPTLQAWNDAQTRGNSANSTQLNADKGLVDSLTTQIDSYRSAGQNIPPALSQQLSDALNKYYTDSQSIGTAGNNSGSSSDATITGPAQPVNVSQWIGSKQPMAQSDVSNLARTALQTLGLPVTSANLNAVINIAQRESSFEPGAVNSTPVGSEHATGLMQTLPSTFKSNEISGHTNILNPLDNMLAAINYMDNRYGSPTAAWTYWQQHNAY